MSERLSLVIGAREFRNWTRYEVESDLLTPADAFSFSVGAPTPELVLQARPGQAVTLKAGKDTLMVGRVDEVQIKVDSGSTSLEVLGRDLAADLVDCSASPGWEFYSSSLEDIARKVLAHYGISAQIEAQDGATEKVGRAKVEPGESAWNFLDRLARRKETMLWFRSDGTLVMAAPNYDQSSVGTLKLRVSGDTRVNNVLTSEVRWSIAERYSSVRTMGQKADFLGESSQPSATREDSEMKTLGLKRPLIIPDGEAASWSACDRRARWEIERRRAEGLSLVYGVASHRLDGQLLQADSMLHLIDELAGLDGLHHVTAVRYTLDPTEGTRTRLTLRRKGALLGLPDPVKPEESLF